MKSDKPRILQILSPYGKWKHPRGLQIVDGLSARKMRAAFNGAISKISGRKIPIFIGHPDDKLSGRALPKPVGYIREILETDGGIAVESEYDDNAYRDVLSGKYTGLSPRWEMKRIEGESFRPVRLISAGLTNNPNIPESGRILKIGAAKNGPEMADFAARAADSERRCGRILGMAQKCLERAKENSARIKSEAVGARIEKLSGAGGAEAGKKISAAKLSEMALERSKSLGEPYSRSFAILRREYGCA